MSLVMSSFPSYAANWIDLQPVGSPKMQPSMASSMLMEPSVKVLVVLSMRLIFEDINNEKRTMLKEEGCVPINVYKLVL